MPPAPITSVGYSLHITNNAEICDLVLVVIGNDDLQYHLHDHGSKKGTALVRKTLNKIAERWPEVSFDFLADGSRTITDIV